MGRLLLMWRLTRGDILRRWLRSVLMLAVLAAATSTVTVALALHGVTDSPFARTRIATKGPDVAGLFEPGFHGTGGTYQQFVAFRDAPGVVGSSGPFPIATVKLNANGHQVRVHAEGRDPAPAALDQPLVTAGRWVTPGGVVLERGFADALGVHIGDTVNLDGQRLRVSGVALTSALSTTDPWVWVTQTTLDALAAGTPTWYALNVKLADPAAAPSFVAARNGANTAWSLESWQQIRNDDSVQIRSEQQVLEAGTVLLAVIALSGIAVMVGTRMTEQTRRVGLLKAVGATPRTVAVMLLVENLLIAIAAAAVGLLAGRLAAPTLTTAGNSLLGSAGTPTLTAGTAAVAILLAVTVATAATAGPAIKGARTSTIRALANPARPPQRNQSLIDLSNRLPAPLLLAVRTSARRPARTLLAIASITVAVATTVATLALRHTTVLGVKVAGNVLATARTQSVNHVAASLSAVLLTVAAVNVLFVTWATIIETRPVNALARALGATPRQVTTGLTVTQVIAALIAALAGLPAGFVLYAAVGGNPARVNLPVLLFVSIIPITMGAVAVLAAIPARIAALAPVALSLRSD